MTTAHVNFDDPREFIAYCEGWFDRDDDREGSGGRVPCSRYGTYSDDCQPWAILAASVYLEANGTMPDEAGVLGEMMGLVVNNHDDIASLIYENWYGLTKRVGRALGITRNEVRGLL